MTASANGASHRRRPTRAETRRDVGGRIEIADNRRRPHSGLDGTSPVAFESTFDHDQAETDQP